MHSLLNLITRLPVELFVLSQEELIPPGLLEIITDTGAQVVTATGTLIAKDYL
jgi:hypothetical protein